MNKELVISAIALVIAVVGVFSPVGQGAMDFLGNVTESFWDSAEGYKVDGTVIINGSGGISTTATTSVSNFTQGGGVTATTSPASSALAAAEFDLENIIDITPTIGTGAITITFPASTTFPLGTTVGSWRTFSIFNATTSATGIITVAGGTGINLEGTATSSSNGYKQIAPGGAAVFQAWRASNSDIEVSMVPVQ